MPYLGQEASICLFNDTVTSLDYTFEFQYDTRIMN